MKSLSVVILFLTVLSVGCFESNKVIKKTDTQKKVDADSSSNSEVEKLKVDVAAEEANYENYLNEVEKLLGEKRELIDELKKYQSHLQTSGKITNVPENEQVVSAVSSIKSKLNAIEASISDIRFKARVVKEKETIATYKYKLSTLNTKSRNHGATLNHYNAKIKESKEKLNAYRSEDKNLQDLIERSKKDVKLYAETGKSDPENTEKIKELESQINQVKKAREDKLEGESTVITRKIEGFKRIVIEAWSSIELPKINLPEFKIPKSTYKKEKTKIARLNSLPNLSLDDENGLELVGDQNDIITDMILDNYAHQENIENAKNRLPERLELIGQRLSGLNLGLDKTKKEKFAGYEKDMKELEAEIEKLNTEAKSIGLAYSSLENYTKEIQDRNDSNFAELTRLAEVRDFFVNQKKVEAEISKIGKDVLPEQREAIKREIARLNTALSLYKKAVQFGEPTHLLKLHISRIDTLRGPDSVKSKKNKKK